MGNADLKAVAGSAVATQEKDPTTFPGMLKRYQSEIARALPKHMNADRMARIALTSFRLNPALGKCDPASVFAAMIQASQLGLEPGLNGRAYLIPYGTECQFVPGWKGLVELANRSGRASCWTGSVFTGDEFDFVLGDTPSLKHRPYGEYDTEKLTHTYAIGRVRGNDWPVIEAWPISKVIKHRDRYNKVGKRHYSFENFEMYARKVPLLQVLKYLPSSPELETAIALNDTFESGERQGLTIDGALTGGFTPPPPAENGNGKTDEAPTLAVVLEKVRLAATTDELDLVADLARSLTDPQHQAEADVEIRARRKALAA